MVYNGSKKEILRRLNVIIRFGDKFELYCNNILVYENDDGCEYLFFIFR